MTGTETGSRALGETLHVVEGVLGIGFGIVGADRREADALGHQSLGIAYEPVDDGFDVGAVIADEHDHRALAARDIVERIGLAVGCRQAEFRRRRSQHGRYSSCGHDATSLARAPEDFAALVLLAYYALQGHTCG